MIFRKPGRRTSASLSGAIGSTCTGMLIGTARLLLSLLMLAIVSGTIVLVRLTDGPVVLPGLSRYLVDHANAGSDTVRVAVETAVLDLGDGSVPSGLEFHDVRVTSSDGEPLFAVPRLRASFDFIDLMRGIVRPTRISVIAADAQFIRGTDGRIRFGLGSGDGVSLDGDGRAGTTSAGTDTITQLIDGIVGDAELAPEMSKLRIVEVVNARIVFSDRRAGGRVVTRNATLRVRRDAGGATALLEIAGQGKAEGEIVRLVADRRAGAGVTTVAGRFGQLEVKRLAGFLPALRVLDDIEARAEGEVTARFARGGAPTSISGRIVSDGGALTIGTAAHRFDAAALSFRANMANGEIELTDALVSGPDGEGRITGLVRLEHDSDGAVTGVRAQIDVDDLYLRAGEVFSEPVAFDRGQIVAAWTPEGDSIEISESWLGRSDLAIRLSGRILLAKGGLGADLRAEIETLGMRDLVRLWPKVAAGNARSWVDGNISAGLLHDLTAQFRLRPGSEILSLTAGFTDLTFTYIKGMSPIEDGAGEIHVSLDQLHLDMQSANVRAAGRAIALGGSSVVISDFDAPVTPADIRVTAQGPTAAVLRLIDDPPLKLVTALGLGLDGVDGDAAIIARLRFPLLDALRIRDIDVDTKTRLHNTRLTLGLDQGRQIAVRADRLDVNANAERMHLRGDAVVDGAPVNLDWHEDYAARPGRRTVRVIGTATPELLRNAGLAGDLLTGKAGVTLDITQAGGGPMTFALDADLAGAGLTIAALDWSKQPGSKGRLRAKGQLDPTLTVDRLDFEAPGLTATGELNFRPDGGIRRALFSKVAVPERLDAGVLIETDDDGIPSIRLTGAMLNVSGMLDGGRDGSAGPMRLRLDLGYLRVTESMVIHAAAGDVRRTGKGAVSGRITGMLGSDAPVSIDLDIPGRGEGRVTLRSPNAGAALRHTEIYRGATGGELHIEARIPEAEGTGVNGQARIDNVTVRSEATFRDVLEDGGLKSAGEAVSGSGLSFRSISIPFRYLNGVVTVTDAIAVSPMLGLKMTGTLDENTEAVDMIGVLSPAYALTGALNQIPLVGQLLSGGRGEGIVGMTFTLKGAMRDPRFSVNPLSLLAPGLLRKLFSGGDGEPGSDFKVHGKQEHR